MPLIDPITISSSAGAGTPSKPSLPIDLLPTQLAQFISYAHPSLLLTSFYMRFPALVADPVDTLLRGIGPLVVLQVVFCVGCLPAVGTTPATTTGAKAGKKGKKGDRRGEGGVAGVAFTTLLSLLLTSISTIPLFLLTIAFGAPLTTHLPQTFLFVAYLALLTVFPLIYVHGTNAAKWRDICGLESKVDEVFGATLGGMLGAWCGAVPIPLDWDRAWQRWPVTVLTGAVLGVVVGRVMGGMKGLRGRRVVL